MVKVQKPTPKTLSKVGKVESSIKKKKLDNQKAMNTKVDYVSAPDNLPTDTKKKKQKAKLIEETVKKAKVLAPAQDKKKNAKSEKNQKELKKSKAPLSAPPKLQKQNKPIEAALTKRPGVTAPPESPTPIPKTPSGKAKNKKAKKGAPTQEAPTTTVIKKKNKKNKKQKVVANKDAAAAKPKPQIQELTKMQKKKATIKAFNKQKLKNKQSGKEKKERIAPKHIFEPVPFDEDKFKAILSVENIKKIAKALKTQVEKEVISKKTSIFNDYQYFLNVSSFKIPSCPKRIVKLSLKHSLVDKDDDVVIIVPDLQRGSKIDYEPTIQHYEDIFREAGVEGLKVMSFNQLKKECSNFEAVRKFGNTYDYFLCDGRLCGQIAGFCGKVFQKPRTTFHAVRLENPKTIKNEIGKSLRRTAYKQLAKGDLISIPVGNHKYTMQQLAENIDHVIANLKNLYPGGLGNVRSINLKISIAGTSSLPLYISVAQVPPDTPYVVGTREQRMLKMKKDANEVLSKFAMTKNAVILKLSKDQIENKRQIKEAKAALGAQAAKNPSDNDGEESAVPAKKSKKEEKAEVEKDLKKKNSEEEAEPQEDVDEDPEDDSDDSDEEVADGDDDDDDDDDDDNDNDEEGNADVDDGDDDEDEDDNDDDDDEDGGDDDDEEDDSD